VLWPGGGTDVRLPWKHRRVFTRRSGSRRSQHRHGVFGGGTSLVRSGSPSGQSEVTAETEPIVLEFQSNGDLVLSRKVGTHSETFWTSGTAGTGADSVSMQADGNLVIYGSGRALWASNTDGHPGAQLEVQDDGNAIIYDVDRTPLWSSGTVWMPKARSRPAVVRRDGSTDIVLVGEDAAVWWQRDTSGWVSLGGTIVSELSAVSFNAQHIDVFGIGTDGQVYHNWFADGHSWSGWEVLDGLSAVGDPSACSWAPGRIDVFARGDDDGMWHRWFDGNWSASWEPRSGVCTSSPSAVSWGPNRIDVVVRGTDLGVWLMTFDGNWTGWQSLGKPANVTELLPNPALMSPAAGWLHLSVKHPTG
jgi:hypothetical protein